MLNSDERMLRGLSIAVIVLSALALAGLLLVFIMLGLGSALVAGAYADSDALFAMLGFGVAALALIWLGLCHAAVLTAGILGLRSCTRPETRRTAFGWSVAGAIISLLGGNLITMGLLIGAAVYLDKLRAQERPPYQPPMPPTQPTSY